ncbi:MAG: sensor histidine kinase [Chitinophagales bacterium]|nr:sensor histidine kinase [Chitinophagales bacterium]
MPGQDIQISESEIIRIFFIVLIFIALLLSFLFIIIVTYYRTNTRRQAELLKAIVETQEKERGRIAMDMHDELGPLLSAVKLHVGAIKNTPPLDLTAVVLDTQDLLDEAIGQIRQIIRDLVPRNIHQKGLAGAIYDMQQYFETYSSVKIHLHLDELTERFSLQSEINIYRIIQEIVNNAVKHAETKEIIIAFHKNDQHLKIEISDKGKGFDFTKISNGSGLKNIESRIRLNKGYYEVKSGQGQGTAYFIAFQKINIV